MKGTSFFAITGCSGKGKIDPSLYALNVDGDTLLLDAGYLSGSSKSINKVLKDLERLEPQPIGILISHAHLDHVGLLPVLHNLTEFRKIPIVMTKPTQIFSESMLKDELIHNDELKQFGCSESNIKETLDWCTIKDIDESVRIGSTKITILAAGHIPGAVGFLIQGKNGKRFFTLVISVLLIF